MGHEHNSLHPHHLIVHKVLTAKLGFDSEAHADEQVLNEAFSRYPPPRPPPPKILGAEHLSKTLK